MIRSILYLTTMCMCILFSSYFDASGQEFHMESTTAVLTSPCRLNVSTDAPLQSHIDADLVVVNPSLLLPFDVGFLENGSVTRLNDSTYRVSGRLTNSVFHIFCETLAGSDSLTDVCLRNIHINSAPITSATCASVLVVSEGTPLPYVRFAWLGEPYPNPVRGDEPISLPYRIDISSEVVFSVYALSGNRLILQESTFVEKGYHTFTFALSNIIASGWYFVVMETGSGTAQQIVVYLR